MADPLYPLINGHRHDFSSIECSMKGKRQLGLKSLDYGHGLEPGKVSGTSAQKLGRTRGMYEAEGSFEMYLHEWEEFKAVLGDGFMEVPFDITANYAETGQPIITDKLAGCRITKVNKSGASDSSDPITVKVELDVMYLLENGKSAIVGLRK